MFSHVVTSELDRLSWLVLAARACLPLTATSRAWGPTVCWLLVPGRPDAGSSCLTSDFLTIDGMASSGMVLAT